MRTVRTVADLRAALTGAPRPVALVPTMGALHAGHLALVARARALAGEGTVVVTLFVNPAQFGEAADLAAYPRDEARDAVLAQDAGTDVLFAPPVAEIYPPGFATTITVGGPAGPLEGEHRGPEHFAGVATVVAKLLIAAAPDVALFGQKDAQQLAVIRRLVADLALPVRVEAVATVREPDGLALSSRNVRLTGPGDRDRALALHRGLRAAEDAVAGGERDAAAISAAALAALAPVEPEYLALVDPETFLPVAAVNGRDALLAVAARVGDVRLIDNTLLRSPG